MGQKVHPESIRVGYIHDWKSNWFNEKNFADYLHEDTQIREHIVGRLSHAGLSDITIRKNANEVEVNIHTARPGIVIGKSGSEVDQLRRDLHRITNKQVKVNILEIKRPELDARLVAQSIAEQLQNRVAFRRAMKRALTSAMRSGAKGVKVQVSGRLGGAEMARTESYSDGRVPLHTLRADIDYGFHEAKTTFGRIGVKCWINKGEIMPEGYTRRRPDDHGRTFPAATDRGGRDGRDTWRAWRSWWRRWRSRRRRSWSWAWSRPGRSRWCGRARSGAQAVPAVAWSSGVVPVGRGRRAVPGGSGGSGGFGGGPVAPGGPGQGGRSRSWWSGRSGRSWSRWSRAAGGGRGPGGQGGPVVVRAVPVARAVRAGAGRGPRPGGAGGQQNRGPRPAAAVTRRRRQPGRRQRRRWFCARWW